MICSTLFNAPSLCQWSWDRFFCYPLRLVYVAKNSLLAQITRSNLPRSTYVIYGDTADTVSAVASCKYYLFCTLVPGNTLRW